MPITQKAEPFLVSHFFLPFDSISSKAMADFSIRSALDVMFLLAVLPFCHFSWVGGIQLYWFESSLLLLPFFHSSLFWFPEVPFLVHCEWLL